MGTVADGFTRVVAHPSVDRGEWVVRNELTPGLFVPAGGGMGKPGLDVLSGRATGIAGRQQIDVDGSTLAHRPGPGLTMRQVCKRREVIALRCGRASTGIPAGVLVTSHFPSIGFAGELGVATTAVLDGKIVGSRAYSSSPLGPSSVRSWVRAGDGHCPAQMRLVHSAVVNVQRGEVFYPVQQLGVATPIWLTHRWLSLFIEPARAVSPAGGPGGWF